MKHSEDKHGRLVIEADAEDRAAMQRMEREIGEEFDSDETMRFFLTPIERALDLDWIDPSVTGDLTDAPMLAVLGDVEPGAGGVLVGRWPDAAGVVQGWYRPVLKRWAFMDYQITSPQRQLLETGRCVWDSGS